MQEQDIKRMREAQGFIAALDQSGGSTPKTLALYGINAQDYGSEAEMFDLMHAMRARMLCSPAFTADSILGAILFAGTLDRQIAGQSSTEYLRAKGILPFLKIDKGLAEVQNQVALMKPITDLENLLSKAVSQGIFGTKMRSVIKGADRSGIAAICQQQFALAKIILSYGLVPIIEPEVDINIPDKAAAEALLREELKTNLDDLPAGSGVVFKLSLPSEADYYRDLVADPRVLRVVALSGGYDQREAISLLRQNTGVIASFSRALAEGLRVQQSDQEFDEILGASIAAILDGSLHKLSK